MPQWIGVEIERDQPLPDFVLERHGLLPADAMSEDELKKRGIEDWVSIDATFMDYSLESVLRAIFGE